jgi:hypothetical protein
MRFRLERLRSGVRTAYHIREGVAVVGSAHPTDYCGTTLRVVNHESETRATLWQRLHQHFAVMNFAARVVPLQGERA